MAKHDEVEDGWRKSTTSGDGNCVEVRIADAHVFVRNTKHDGETILRFSHSEWRAFLTGVRLGEFELPE